MTAGALAERKQVDVVIHPRGCVEALLEGATHVESVPPGHDRRGDRAAAGEVDRARDAHRDAPDRHVGVMRQDVVDISRAFSMVSAGPWAMSRAGGCGP